MTAFCLKPQCERTWPRDPVLEVPCPTCHAGVGMWCRRPSGHSFKSFHRERDIAADLAGAYGRCPTGRCGLAVTANLRPTQHDLFEGLTP